MLVPNVIVPNCRLAVLGEAPGRQEAETGMPFVGGSGQLLFGTLSQLGIQRSSVSILNVSQHRPPNNDFNSLEWGDPEIQLGLTALEKDLLTANPNCLLALGNAALHVAMEGRRPPIRTKNRYLWNYSISNYRGSVLSSAFAPKVVASLHPAAILRNYSDKPLFNFDVARAVQQSSSRELPLLKRNFILEPDLATVLSFIANIRTTHRTIAIDIEGGVGKITCIGIAVDHSTCLVVPFGSSHWTEEEEFAIWFALSGMLLDPHVPKILQNYLYDAFVLGWYAKAPIRGLVDDTMLAHWELFPELEKSLDVQCSIYTLQPYYKHGRKALGLAHLEYCATDCVVTYEARDAILAQLHGDSLRHYRTNLALLAPFLYMQWRGIRFDQEEVKRYKADLLTTTLTAQHEVNCMFKGRNLTGVSQDAVLQLVAARCCYKKSFVATHTDLLKMPKAPFLSSIQRLSNIVARWPNVTDAERGFVETETAYGVNVDSSKQLIDLIYHVLGLPPQYKKERGRRTDRLSTDALSLLSLYGETRDDRLKAILRLRQKLDQLSALKIKCDGDGRMRCSYNVVGTDTGRVSSYATAHGTGGNMQNRTKSQRRFWRADPGYDFFQLDLVGADGYTVAARVADLGDSTMLDDYSSGVKPKNVVALMYEHGIEINSLPRDEIKRMSKTLDADGWLVFASKVGQHGVSYGMGSATLSDTILKLSFKFGEEPIYVEPAVCERIRQLFLSRYWGIKMWHRDCEARLKETGTLRCASGHTRRFYGRRNDVSTLKAYLAEEPQQNTTFLTNLACLNLWRDPENRRPNNSLIIEPLHQVHDALCGQWPSELRSWAIPKIKSYFNNPLTIGKITLTIPFEGGWGKSWGECENEL